MLLIYLYCFPCTFWN